MAVINVQNWSVEQVVDWVTGLDPSLSQYAQMFASKSITGQKLLNLMTGDLMYVIGIQRTGDQMLLHDAIQTLRDELQTPWTTLQTLSLALSVRCKNYRSELTQQKQRIHDAIMKEEALMFNHDHHHHHGHHHHHHHKASAVQNNVKSSAKSSSSSVNSSTAQPSAAKIVETIPTTSLDSASYLLDAGKVLIRWLARFPFLGKLNYDEISRKLTKHCFELAVLSQRDSFADNAIEEVQYLCTKIIELCEVLIHSNDSLAIQPAGIDVITLRKRAEQDWGLQFESSYWGIHQITGVKLSTPAQQSGHLERGDEILQVNYQTVLAWPQSSVISMLHENENEVILTVKRRPRHASTNLLLIGGHQNNMYLNKLPNRKSFFERKAARERVEQERSVVLQEVVLVEEDEKKDEPVNTITKVVEEEEEEEERSKAEVRFWKLYPKPKYLIKRRATVTGASPTETRPPVTFITDNDDAPQPVNQTPSQHQNHHAPVHHRRSTPVTTHTPPGTVTSLLHPPCVQRPPLDKSRSAPETVEELDKQIDEEDDVFVGTVVAQPRNNTPPTPKPRLSRPSGGLERTTSVVVESTRSHSPDKKVSLSSSKSPSRSPIREFKVNKPEEVKPLSKPVEIKPTSQAEQVTQEKAASPNPPEQAPNPPQVTPPTPISRTEPPATPVTPSHAPRLLHRETPPLTPPPRLPTKPTLPPRSQSTQHRSPSPPPPALPPRSDSPPKPLHRGILHIRSQLRKQSSSNSSCALPVIGQSSMGSTTSLLCSSSPRWIRQNAVFYSNKELEIINPGSKVGSPTGNLRVKIGEGRSDFVVQPASEVHSRPFAFKITSGESVTYYLAAESQVELDQWMSVMTTGEIPPSSSTVGARRSFARAPYKRSISLGSSQSPSASTSNITVSSQTPPPSSLTHTRTPPRFYASSTNLSAYRTRAMTPQSEPRGGSLLNRSKSSSLKTDWFLRNSNTTTPSSSNISSITITSKKVNRSQVATQYPTPTGTPTKQCSQSQQPMMGMAMKQKKNSVSSTSPTRKYMCPNCCNVVKIDMGTQTETDTVKLVFFNNGESRV